MFRYVMVLSISALTLFTTSLTALEIEGVTLPDTTTPSESTTELVLNGAGVRSKFIFDIYVAGLYLPEQTTDEKTLLASPPPNRIAMHFIYSKVDKKKLDAAWVEGFEDNNSAATLAGLSTRLQRFMTFFNDAVEGDVIWIDYLPNRGTRVAINGEEKGWIEGADFNAAVLSVWLGQDPVNTVLKAQMLGRM